MRDRRRDADIVTRGAMVADGREIGRQRVMQGFDRAVAGARDQGVAFHDGCGVVLTYPTADVVFPCLRQGIGYC